MELSHTDPILPNPALERLGQFVQQQRQKWTPGEPPDWDQFEQELHAQVLKLECDLLAEALAHYDVDAASIEVEGNAYHPVLTSSETYLSAAGPLTVTRHLYRAAGRGSKSICPLELRAGIVAGYFTPRAARQAAFAVAHLTPGESETLFQELDNMRPSRASLDRLPKLLSSHWEHQRAVWEAALRIPETVPPEATVLTLSSDGVMAPMQAGAEAHHAKQSEPGKHAGGPTGHREVGCGTVVLYEATGERLQTIRYARMPERNKLTLQEQLMAEAQQVVGHRPELRRVYLADGAKDNWRLLATVEQSLPAPVHPSVEIVDFYHACEHLKRGCDAAWGESTVRGQAEFARLKIMLKDADGGAAAVIRVLKYQRGRARGHKRQRLETELGYFRQQQTRMEYARYGREGLPIASGVMEAACKTLVTQRLKRSGMAWTPAGGQAILTLRSVIQSERWAPAWELLSADFRKTVVIHAAPQTNYRELPLAA